MYKDCTICSADEELTEYEYNGYLSDVYVNSKDAVIQEEYIKVLEELTATKIGIISTSPDRKDTIIVK